MNELLFLSILTFPQSYKNGKLNLNILLLPRNINPLIPIKDESPAFVDAEIQFVAKVINSLDGLPLISNAEDHRLIIDNTPSAASIRAVWESLKTQFELNEKIRIDDAETNKNSQRAASPDTYKQIRKYLPLTYRNAFNFTKPRTKYAVTDDSYLCAVRNKKPSVDTSTNRDVISWGKVIAYCLRNPELAKKAGLIYEASMMLDRDEQLLFEQGGWLYTDFDQGSNIHSVERALYASRIPALNEVTDRNLFSAVQFRVHDEAQNANAAAYDRLIKEAIQYDDGFAKIVHANQPINQDLQIEEDHSNPPIKDVGIRLGWEDEQIAIWYNRQMKQEEEETGTKVDAPLGVFGYRVDARLAGSDRWFSQNLVQSRNAVVLPQNNIEILPSGAKIEPGYEVYPAAHGDAKRDGFWLPMYCTSWIGKSITIADTDAEDIHLLRSENFAVIDEDNQAEKNNLSMRAPKRVFHPYTQDVDHLLPLRYGNRYDFRVRLMDITGGGPKYDSAPIHGGENPIEQHHFIRLIQPGIMRIMNLERYFEAQPRINEENELKDYSVLENFLQNDDNTLYIRRPLLSYPAVVFTNKYERTGAVDRLKSIMHNISSDNPVQRDIGLADPDVTHVSIRVEAKSLQMDNGASISGKESYIELYTKDFELPSNLATEDYDLDCRINIVYRDYEDVHLNESFAKPEDETEYDLILPTARNLRLTIIPIIKDLDTSYGHKSIEQGKPTYLTSYRPSFEEENLLSNETDNLRAIYLQPENESDKATVKQIEAAAAVIIKAESDTPIELARLAEATGLMASKLNLQGKPGQRIQFGCSRIMRHSLAPDSSSVTFSSLSELFNHWIIPIDINLERDWSWDGLAINSLSIYRRWVVDEDHQGEEELAGILQVSEAANITSLKNPDRSKTRLVFLDAFDPKVTVETHPREFSLYYEIRVHFKENWNREDVTVTHKIKLPITISPQQTPGILSSGIALSPYIPDTKKYAYTEPRRKYLWFELSEGIKDPDTTYYVRVMASAPDPMLARVTNEMFQTDIKDTPIPLDPEKIRSIIGTMDNDHAGMGIMQEMVCEELPDGAEKKIYMVPLPENLHADSDELFGFFTYELRVGYKREIWSTAQARYGTPLKINGVQHPAPNLYCTAHIKTIFRKPSIIDEVKVTATPTNIEEMQLLDNMLVREIMQYKQPDKVINVNDVSYKKLLIELQQRDKVTEKIKFLDKEIGREVQKLKSKKVIVIKAPYASAVSNGKNVTANPPQTSLWYLLYTQVLQADGTTYRNLLLDSGMLRPSMLKSSVEPQNIMDGSYYGHGIDEAYFYKEEGKVFGTALVSLPDIKEKLVQLGLPTHSDISVLCVEMFPMSNVWQLERRKSNDKLEYTTIMKERYESVYVGHDSDVKMGNPLTDDLGNYRIYRTSPLVALDSGCCDDC